MSELVDIKNKIGTLSPIDYQVLCDSILHKVYLNLKSVSFGSSGSANKTVKGTPDCRLYDEKDKTYIFAQYSSSKASSKKKILSDVKKCLDPVKTKIPVSQIKKIIFCDNAEHPSADYSKEAEALCQANHIVLEVYERDDLAFLVKDRYPSLANECLGMELSSGQILDIDEFIKTYDYPKTSAKLDTDFVGREKELDSVEQGLANSNCVVVAGSPGVGKTRLAIEACRRFSQKNGFSFYCIKDKHLPLAKDFGKVFEDGAPLLFLIDDANNLAQLDFIVGETIGYLSQNRKVKIVCTVRGYAFKDVAQKCKQLDPIVVSVSVLDNKFIESLAKNTFGITNPLYLEQIVKVSKGNPRVAYLLCSIAVKENKLNSIRDASDMMDDTYANSVRLIEENDQDGFLFKTAGIIGIFGPVRLDKLETLSGIFHIVGITFDQFKEGCKKLNDIEEIDYPKEQVATFSDQCLATYILKKTLFDDCEIPLIPFLGKDFGIYREKIVGALNNVFSTYDKPEYHAFLKDQVSDAWEEMERANAPVSQEFIEAFGIMFPEKTISLLADYVPTMPKPYLLVPETDFKYEQPSIFPLKICSQLIKIGKAKPAAQILESVIARHPEIHNQVIGSLTDGFSLTYEDVVSGFGVQRKGLADISDLPFSEAMQLLLGKLLEYLLKFDFEENSFEGRDFQIRQFSLPSSKNALAFRDECWDFLSKLEVPIQSQVALSFAKEYPNQAKGLYENDVRHIERIVPQIGTSLYCSIIKREISKVITISKLDINMTMATKDPDDSFLSSLEPKRYSDWYKEDSEWIGFLAKKYGALGKEDFIFLVSRCKEYLSYFPSNSYQIVEVLFIAFQGADSLEESIERINLISNCLSPSRIIWQKPIRYLLSKYSASKVFESFQRIGDPRAKERVTFDYFGVLPDDAIDDLTIERLKTYFDSLSDGQYQDDGIRSLDFLKRYESKSAGISIFVFNHLLNKKEANPIVSAGLFSQFVEDFGEVDPAIISSLGIEQLKAINDFVLRSNRQRPYGFEKLTQFILQKDPSYFLGRTEWMINLMSFDFSDLIWGFSNSFDRADAVFQDIVSERGFYLDKDFKLEKMLFSSYGKAVTNLDQEKAWISHRIKADYSDSEKMKPLFSCVASFPIEERIHFIGQLLSLNDDFLLFKELPIEPSSFSWSGDSKPMYLRRIGELRQIDESIDDDIRFAKHHAFLARFIKGLESECSQAELDDIARQF